MWAYFGGAHHDLDVADDGRIYVLVREVTVIPRINAKRPVLEDLIAVLDPDGQELYRVPVLEAFENSEFAGYLEGMRDSGDILHTNAIELLDGRLADRIPAFEKGNVLICVRELDVVAVVDVRRGQVVWATKRPWRQPHHPTVLPNGNIMIFDNKGYRKASRIIEFDPVSQEDVWTYHADPPEDFQSNSCGFSQRFPDGNTLITESDHGRAFEIEPDGTIVWEYLNPARAGEANQYIATLFEMVRLPPDFPLDWID